MFDKTPPITRMGKTARDHESGAWARRWDNHDARKSWDRETTMKNVPGKRRFPLVAEDGRGICNGRESRALQKIHKCRPATPGKKGGGPCRHRRGKKA